MHDARRHDASAQDASLRAFVAVLLPAEVRRQLAQAAGEIGRDMRFVKWVEEENTHLTLAFLGEIAAERAARVAAALRELAAAHPAFAMRLDGIGAFPSTKRPRVIWAGVAEGKEEAAALGGGVTERLEPLGFPREKRPFSPHVTLGRLRDPRALPPLLVQRLSAARYSGRVFPVEAFHLMKSQLTRSGPIYHSLEEFRLAGSHW